MKLIEQELEKSLTNILGGSESLFDKEYKNYSFYPEIQSIYLSSDPETFYKYQKILNCLFANHIYDKHGDVKKAQEQLKKLEESSKDFKTHLFLNKKIFYIPFPSCRELILLK